MGGIDGVVNAAGIFASEGLTDTSPELFARVLTVNITGTFLIIRAAERFLRAADAATIVNIGSGVGITPTGPGSTAYVASKGGVIAMTRVLAMELAPKIRVNVVCPGMVETAMTESFLRNNQGEIRPEIARLYALGRAATADELANAILFLTSDESLVRDRYRAAGGWRPDLSLNPSPVSRRARPVPPALDPKPSRPHRCASSP